jgi:hypothetical protein
MDHFHFKATLVARSWSRSKPDILYGYVWKAFTPAQEQFMAIDMTEHTANSQGLIYPFLVIELKGDGPSPTAGSLWVATNQCLLGGAAACMVSQHSSLGVGPDQSQISFTAIPGKPLHRRSSRF